MVARPVPPRRSAGETPAIAPSETGPSSAWLRPDPAHSHTPVASTGTAAARARARVIWSRSPSTASAAVICSIAS